MHFLRKVILFLALFPVAALADTYPEVVFDNSIVKGSYAKSQVSYSGQSWVENVNKHLLVSDTLFFTPGNALSLKYISANEGNWETSINYNRQKFNYTVDESDFLSIRIYINSPKTTVKDLPRVFIRQQHASSDTLSLEPYVVKLEHKKWLHVKVPVKKFHIRNKQAIVLGVGFAQNASSANTHHLLLDQLEFLPLKYSEIPLRSAAILSEATAYDRAVHLKWQLPLSPSIRYIKIYRAMDGKNFKAIGIRPVPMQSCLDMVPVIGQKYQYQISWVDYNYQESPLSTAKEVETSALGNDEILKLVQLANVNYFVENFDINSGMYMPFRSKNKVIVSTEETAGAILSLIVGVKNDFLTRQNALNRISKITFFLMRSQNKNGFFPSFYDARKGVPEYRNELAIYDVKATGAIMEALLIAREFFNENNDSEKDLRTRISQLYQQIKWNEITESNNLLKSKLALLDNEGAKNKALSGTHQAINTYLLAVGNNKYALPVETYTDAVYHKFENITVDTTQSINPYYFDEEIEQEDFQTLRKEHIVDTTIKVPVFSPKQEYGVNLAFGKLGNSLLELYKPFMTVRPSSINDSLTNWNEVLTNYTLYIKRRDNELGLGATNSDIWGYYKNFDNSGNSRINPAIGASSIFVDKDLGMQSIINLYKQYGDLLFSEFGFRSWLDLRNDDVSDEYISSNQAAIAVMIENAKTGFIWDLYEKIPELKPARESLFGNKKQ
ncbi:glucoamylase family protein [Sphingobacterium litopenaei]|uniref:Glycoamylase-like domain-containing protein n=1 Tax=Sphingobacterium litopenaei TaxID=2763500 RepID=A0ABR7YB47_9SPHI|nr:glucoamylase family protein [Sphingobacterium litopenaei]MBD1428522.1 hypothetical protein [Sphingobacterium litopenaei]